MPKYYNPNVLDSGLSHIKTNADEMRLLKAYTAGDSHATVLTNSIATIAVVTGDFTLGNQGTLGRQLAVAAKSGTANADSGATPDLHIAIVDSVGTEVLAVTDETSDQVVTNGNPVDVPTFNLKQNQPV